MKVCNHVAVKRFVPVSLGCCLLLAVSATASSAEAEREKKAPELESLSGSVEWFNHSPKGAYDSLMLKSGDKLVQVNFPPGAAADVAKAVPVGDSIRVVAEAEEAKGDHAVFKAQSITDAKGVKMDLRGLEPAEPGKPKPKPGKPKPGEPKGLKPKPQEPEETQAMERIAGKITRLNYARHGEVNGAVLESGDFVHLGPKVSQELKLAVGQELAVEGPATAMPSGGKAIEHPTKVNGKAIQPSPPPKATERPKKKAPKAPGPKDEK
jgi:hypothetical protein